MAAQHIAYVAMAMLVAMGLTVYGVRACGKDDILCWMPLVFILSAFWPIVLLAVGSIVLLGLVSKAYVDVAV